MRKTIYDEAIVADQFRAFIKNNIFRGFHYFTKTEVGKKVASVYFLLAIVYVIMLTLHNNSIFVEFYCFGLVLFFFVIVPIAICYVAGEPWKYDKIEKAFIKSGVVNATGEPPAVLYKHKNKNATVYTIMANGVSPSAWSEVIPVLQTALNLNIAKVIESKGKNIFEMWTVPPQTLSAVTWNDEFTDENDSIIKLGTGYLGDISYDCNINPHACIVATSGGGKTRLLFSIIEQFLLHNAQVIVTDMKGGADFKRFENRIYLATTEQNVLNALERIILEMDIRKGMFYDLGVSNIVEYRNLTGHYIPRILFCVDEAVQLLDKTGLKKEDKAVIEEIEKHITTISQMGRSFGISLILSGQRLDRTTISPRIFNNLDIKIAGRCDDVLSHIMFNDNRADELIPKTSVGLFINQDNELFRSYHVE